MCAQDMHVGTSLYSWGKSLCTYANCFTGQQIYNNIIASIYY